MIGFVTFMSSFIFKGKSYDNGLLLLHYDLLLNLHPLFCKLSSLHKAFVTATSEVMLDDAKVRSSKSQLVSGKLNWL